MANKRDDIEAVTYDGVLGAKLQDGRRLYAFSVSQTFIESVMTSKAAGLAVAERVLDRLTEQIVSDVLGSAAVQARIATIRAELPVRIEEAVAKAIVRQLNERDS